MTENARQWRNAISQNEEASPDSQEVPQHFQLLAKSNVKLLLVLTIMFWLSADSSLQGDHKHGEGGKKADLIYDWH